MRKSLIYSTIHTGWCHSSVGRAKDWKSLCPRFDSWWYHLKINDLQKCRSFFFSSRRSPLLCGSRTGPDLQRIRCTFGRRGRSEDRVVKTVTNGLRHQLFRRCSGCFRCFIQQFFYFCIFQKGRKVAWMDLYSLWFRQLHAWRCRFSRCATSV